MATLQAKTVLCLCGLAPSILSKPNVIMYFKKYEKQVERHFTKY